MLLAAGHVSEVLRLHCAVQRVAPDKDLPPPSIHHHRRFINRPGYRRSIRFIFTCDVFRLNSRSPHGCCCSWHLQCQEMPETLLSWTAWLLGSWQCAFYNNTIDWVAKAVASGITDASTGSCTRQYIYAIYSHQ